MLACLWTRCHVLFRILRHLPAYGALSHDDVLFCFLLAFGPSRPFSPGGPMSPGKPCQDQFREYRFSIVFCKHRLTHSWQHCKYKPLGLEGQVHHQGLSLPACPATEINEHVKKCLQGQNDERKRKNHHILLKNALF